VHGAEQRKGDYAQPRPHQGERAETDEHREQGYVTHHARFGEVTKIFFSLGLTLLVIDARQKLFFLIVTIAMSFALVTIKGIYWAVMTGAGWAAIPGVFHLTQWVVPHFFTLLRRWFCDARRSRSPATGRRIRVARS